jgi:hypothetical protein
MPKCKVDVLLLAAGYWLLAAFSLEDHHIAGIPVHLTPPTAPHFDLCNDSRGLSSRDT